VTESLHNIYSKFIFKSSIEIYDKIAPINISSNRNRQRTLTANSHQASFDPQSSLKRHAHQLPLSAAETPSTLTSLILADGLDAILQTSNAPERRRQRKADYNKMDVSDNHFESKRIVFVTVGTTSFDSLVRTVDTDQVKKELSKKGYTHLIIQMGRGSYIPNKSSGEDGSLVVDYFTFSSSIADYLRSASLVISHAGSGSIFETLRLGKPLIVVVNEDLMDNHQSELAEELAERKHLFCGRPQTLYQVIEALDLDSIVPYQSGDASPVAKLINRYLGFPAD
ncbi:Glycosyl transferase, family 28, C-terminal, partial [Cynara cardunculus var. scolymus]